MYVHFPAGECTHNTHTYTHKYQHPCFQEVIPQDFRLSLSLSHTHTQAHTYNTRTHTHNSRSASLLSGVSFHKIAHSLSLSLSHTHTHTTHTTHDQHPCFQECHSTRFLTRPRNASRTDRAPWGLPATRASFLVPMCVSACV